VTLLLDPPTPVELDQVEEVMSWVVEVDWWTSEPVSREYRLVVRDQLLCEIYRDRGPQPPEGRWGLRGGPWYLERVYD
jgi:hypothetical protein